MEKSKDVSTETSGLFCFIRKCDALFLYTIEAARFWGKPAEAALGAAEVIARPRAKGNLTMWRDLPEERWSQILCAVARCLPDGADDGFYSWNKGGLADVEGLLAKWAIGLTLWKWFTFFDLKSISELCKKIFWDVLKSKCAPRWFLGDRIKRRWTHEKQFFLVVEYGLECLRIPGKYVKKQNNFR